MLTPRPIEEAPRDGTKILAWTFDDPECPQIVRWTEHDELARAECGEPGFWEYAENLIADVCGACEPVCFVDLPKVDLSKF